MKRPGLVNCYHGFTIYYTIVHNYTYNIRSFRRLKNIRILRPEKLKSWIFENLKNWKMKNGKLIIEKLKI